MTAGAYRSGKDATRWIIRAWHAEFYRIVRDTEDAVAKEHAFVSCSIWDDDVEYAVREFTTRGM